MEKGQFAGIFIKIGQEDHINALQKKGSIFCRNVHEFSVPDGKKVRQDDLENVVETHFMRNYILSIRPLNTPDAKYTKLKLDKANIIAKRNDAYGNLYCIYSANIHAHNENEEFFMDKEMASFGSHYCIIFNVSEFIKRLHTALEAKGYTYDHHLVKYLEIHEKEARIEKTIFQKDKAYSYQNEWRLFIPNEIKENIVLEIGDLSDITMVGKVSENGMRFKWQQVK